MLLPTGYTLYGHSNNGDTLTAYKAGSTASEPRFLIIDRKQAAWNPRTSSWSVPSYRVRIFAGILDGEGTPRPERVLSEANFRFPVGGEGVFTTPFADLLAFLGQADVDDEIVALTLPLETMA